MMLMTMRPQKDQFTDPLVYKYTAVGASTFDKRDKALMFGFTQYDALLVGGAGGVSGYATSDSYIGTYTAYRCGPGGGGCLVLQGPLTSLSKTEAVTVGNVGGNGADAASNNKAGNGGNGGSSSFKGHSAYGGGGGLGDQWVTGPAAHKDKYNVGGYGGAGGGNSANLGAGSAQHRNGDYYYSAEFNTTSTIVGTAAAAGSFVAGGTAPVVGGGRGGAGGTGDNTGVPGDVSRAGASGANGSAYAAAGGGIVGTNGGSGGGADLFPFTGVHEYYGNNISGKVATGAVVIKIS